MLTVFWYWVVGFLTGGLVGVGATLLYVRHLLHDQDLRCKGCGAFRSPEYPCKKCGAV